MTYRFRISAKHLLASLAGLFLLSVAGAAYADQASTQTATITAAAPIYPLPDATRQPLRVAREGSILRLLDTREGWAHVEFQDPEFGRQAGYVELKFVRISTAAPTPVLLAAPRDTPSTLATPAITSQAAGVPRVQRGDVAFGYTFMHESGLSLPLGIAFSESFRVHPNVDIAIDEQFNHGSLADVGTNIWAILVGPRFHGGSRYGDNVSLFGQVLLGLGGVNFSHQLDSISFSGVALQPGFGVEVPLTPTVAIRPQVDVLYVRLDGDWGADSRYGVNVVFRLFKK